MFSIHLVVFMLLHACMLEDMLADMMVYMCTKKELLHGCNGNADLTSRNMIVHATSQKKKYQIHWSHH
jgi:hypothetical protein